MGISVEDAVKELQARETVFVAYSQATKLPYVTCGEETYNDQVWFFAEEETLKEYGKKKLEDKILLMGMRYEKKDFPRMYGLLFSIGVNSVIWNNGADEIEIDLEKIVRKPDLSQMEPAKRPLINPTLQLSGIYFMQELRRPVEKEEHKNLRALEEELIANLKKSHFLVAMERDEENPKKINIPYLKNKEGQILQPVFSDVMEFEKLQSIIAEVLNVDADEITPETTFVDDLGADSLDVFQIIMGIEEEFDIEIPQEKAEKIVSVGDAAEAIKAAVG